MPNELESSSFSVDDLFAEADAAWEHVRMLAARLLPVAVARRDHYSRHLAGQSAPEEHILPDHVVIARLCQDCESYLESPHPRLDWAKEQYADSQGKLLAFVQEAIRSLDAWINARRNQLGVHPEYADDIRAKLNLAEKYRRYHAQLVDGRGHEVPRLQVTHEGWALTYYSANTEEWGKLAELAPTELIPEEQAIHDMPALVRQTCDELDMLFTTLYDRGAELGLIERQVDEPPAEAPAVEARPTRPQLIRRD